MNLNVDTTNIFNDVKDFYQYLKHKFNETSITMQKFDHLKNKCFILLGETGAGKTSFLELFLNYIRKGNFNFQDYKIEINLDHEDSNNTPVIYSEENRRKSLTLISHKYKINIPGTKDYFYLIDTPGLNDVSGYMADKIHLNSIYRSFQDLNNKGIELIGAMFFYDGTKSKITNLEDYVYESYRIFFPRGFNFRFIATKVDELREKTKSDMIIQWLNNSYVLYFDLLNRRNIFNNCYQNEIMIKYTDEIEDNFNTYMKRNETIESNIKFNIRNFKRIISTMFCVYSESYNLDEIIKNYEIYNTFEKLLNEIIEISDELFAIGKFLIETMTIKKDKINKESKEMEKEIRKLLKFNRNIILTFEEICSNPCYCFPVCKKCYEKLDFVHEKTRLELSPDLIGLRFRPDYLIISNCEHKETKDFLFIRATDRGMYLKNILNSFKRKSDNKKYLVKALEEDYNDLIKKIDHVFERKKLNEIKEMINTFQKKTMLENFELFLNNKINYLNDILIKTNFNSESLKIIEGIIQRYIKMSEILYHDRGQKMKDLLNELITEAMKGNNTLILFI